MLLGHTRDDQAETVLLGLARGSGARSLAGMPARRGRYRRPLLGVGRATLRRPAPPLGLRPWDDPHNADPAFARARVRHQALPALEEALGPGVAEALARTAGQLRADADALDELAASRGAADARRRTAPGGLDALGAAAGRGQDPGAAQAAADGRLPARRADRPARRRLDALVTALARAALDRPARGRPRQRRYGRLLSPRRRR